MANKHRGNVKSLDFLIDKNRNFNNILASKFNHVSDNIVGTTTTHTNTTTAADPATLTIPAGRLNAGSIIKVNSFGTVTDNNSSDTLTNVLNLTHGSTTVALISGAALDVNDADVVITESTIQILTVGTAGTFVAHSQILTDALGATSLRALTTSTAIDTTGDITITMNCDWSVSHAENIYTHLGHTAQIFG